ncbi:glycerate kinase [Nakamurella sp. YIM 132087]|uniref:Glycerate kinase n=1 Tax=Nakamurella alba TaxID=2665158 RepID=A0A7K1FGT5_9ACTN|nr:glycerate kinase [Nakamurella alba]MTD13322.1 glycerate kinase [Nakamurella alba]
MDTARPRILVCPDKFKGTMTAPQAAAAIEAGIRRVLPEAEVHRLPVGDGGEGTVDALLAAGALPRTTTAADPLGRPVPAVWAVRDGTAIIELAAASGLARIVPTDETARTADTFGTGELVRAALDAGATGIVLGLGGSAGTDGGTGILRALGARFSDAAGDPLPPGGAALVDLAEVDLSGLDPRLAGVPVVLCSDVQSPLLGTSGAARVFGPQKGALPGTVEVLEAGLARLAAVLHRVTGRDAAALGTGGAAGGAAAGLQVVLGATLRRGIDLVAELIGLDDRLAGADLLVVGEGSLDEQSLAGKAPVGLAARAARQGVPTVAVAGRLDVPPELLRANGIAAAAAAVELAGSPADAMAAPEQWTTAAAASLLRQVLDDPGLLSFPY